MNKLLQNKKAIPWIRASLVLGSSQQLIKLDKFKRVLMLLLTFDSSVSVPPEITEHPPTEVAFKSGEPVTLRCRAVGSAPLVWVILIICRSVTRCKDNYNPRYDSVTVVYAELAIRRYWIRSLAAPYMPGAHQAFHPCVIGILVTASAWEVLCTVMGWWVYVSRVAVSTVPFIILRAWGASNYLSCILVKS